MKKLPQRTCIACGMKQDKINLIRVVKNNHGEILLDKFGRLPGRGAYICNNIQCLESTIKFKKLEKSFKIKITDSVYDELRKSIKE